MARITVEDCIDKFPSRFELVLIASNRARKLNSGDEPTVDKDNDKNTVIALREIAEESISIENLQNSLIEEHQTVSFNEEDDEDTNFEDGENESNEEQTDDSNLKLQKNDTETEIAEETSPETEIAEETSPETEIAEETSPETEIAEETSPDEHKHIETSNSVESNEINSELDNQEETNES